MLGIANSVILTAIVIFLFFAFLHKKEPQIVYVDNVKVFSTFNMSRDLNRIHQGDLKKQKTTVDSLIGILQKTNAPSENPELQQLFIYENNRLKEMGDYFSNEVSQQVWSRINSYMDNFGKENDYHIILGTQGNGNIMYAKKEIDITEEFIEYANKKYEGE